MLVGARACRTCEAASSFRMSRRCTNDAVLMRPLLLVLEGALTGEPPIDESLLVLICSSMP